MRVHSDVAAASCRPVACKFSRVFLGVPLCDRDARAAACAPRVAPPQRRAPASARLYVKTRPSRPARSVRTAARVEAKKSAPRTEVAAARRAGEETVSFTSNSCVSQRRPSARRCLSPARDPSPGDVPIARPHNREFRRVRGELEPYRSGAMPRPFAPRETAVCVSRSAAFARVGIRPTGRCAAIRQGFWKVPDSPEFGASTQWPHFAAQFG
jgi:hypothetical protein